MKDPFSLHIVLNYPETPQKIAIILFYFIEGGNQYDEGGIRSKLISGRSRKAHVLQTCKPIYGSLPNQLCVNAAMNHIVDTCVH